MYGVEILLSRSLTPFLLSLYLPSSLLVSLYYIRCNNTISGVQVSLSWLSLLLAQPLLRLCLQLLTSLAILHLISVTRAATPPANTITAIEVWLLGCLLLIVLSILELLLFTKYLSIMSD